MQKPVLPHHLCCSCLPTTRPCAHVHVVLCTPCASLGAPLFVVRTEAGAWAEGPPPPARSGFEKRVVEWEDRLMRGHQRLQQRLLVMGRPMLSSINALESREVTAVLRSFLHFGAHG